MTRRNPPRFYATVLVDDMIVDRVHGSLLGIARALAKRTYPVKPRVRLATRQHGAFDAIERDMREQFAETPR